ncbi:hypothetical protein BVG19_g4169 [[Candida] boidinii]|nr:hypothetical protein BVG19_g4169 [[Candida] boidinii]OWB53068.1 hypothetical protein B5S27_g4655 [[Candida] boidinii]
MTLSTALHNREVHCSLVELSYFPPPQGMTCGEYLVDFFQSNPGYVTEPDSTTLCGVCKYSVGDQYLTSIGMSWGNRWRDVGLLFSFTIFDLFMMFLLYYIFRIKKWNPMDLIQKFNLKKKAS